MGATTTSEIEQSLYLTADRRGMRHRRWLDFPVDNEDAENKIADEQTAHTSHVAGMR